jgi:galactose mutarotase-like enzyme
MSQKCTINDDGNINGMKTIFMENELLKIGILAGRGSDIFQFEYKPMKIDIMLRLDKEILNPNQIFSQIRNTGTQFEDYYYGGWQEILPNSAPINYRGAELGQHGEVSLIPWNYEILNTSDNEVSVKLWTRPLRFPILIEKTLTLKEGSSKLFIDETLTNESDTFLHLMWGHHIAFGLPFLSEGATMETSASKFMAEEAMSEQRLFKPGELQEWPSVKNIHNERIDAQNILKSDAHKFSDLAYLNDFKEDAFYTLKTDVMSFSIHWDKNIFKSLWYWQERFATKDAPWWGKTYAIALEPWTSKWIANPDLTLMEKDWLKLEPRQVIKTSLTTNCFH